MNVRTSIEPIFLLAVSSLVSFSLKMVMLFGVGSEGFTLDDFSGNPYSNYAL